MEPSWFCSGRKYLYIPMSISLLNLHPAITSAGTFTESLSRTSRRCRHDASYQLKEKCHGLLFTGFLGTGLHSNRSHHSSLQVVHAARTIFASVLAGDSCGDHSDYHLGSCGDLLHSHHLRFDQLPIGIGRWSALSLFREIDHNLINHQ
jgi:hypothetical protein